MELGIYTFGDLVPDPSTGRTVSAQERMRQMLEMARLADEAGLDVIGVGEHHALRYVNSATAAMIAAMGAVTRRIRLTSASTLISTADPVRTFQEFATADLISGGRVEIIFGRGAFLDNFPLFGYDLKDYDELFAEKLGLFAMLNAQARVTWSGRFRAPLHEAEIAPRPAQKQLPVWIGAGSPASISRAAKLGYPLALPMVGGSLQTYARAAVHYRQTWLESGRAAADIRFATFAHLHVTAGARETREDFYPYYSAYLSPLFKGPMPADAFAQMLSPEGALLGGSAQQVIDKILAQHEALNTTRCVGQIDVGGQPFAQIARGIEIFATRVAPAVRAATATNAVNPEPAAHLR
jgi:alkanesulfonate monooxygenase SsuD/methylene tetrahydromethanopterin reductase-like flavin-dependent oxidoreductase (luciferase family)